MREKILIICASCNKKGNSSLLAKWFIEQANNKKYEFEWVYLYDLDIPYFTNENRNADIKQDKKNQDIRNLINKLEQGKKFIITFPVWNFGLPASLKNMLDRSLCSGRARAKEKKKKIPGWKGKTFYILASMGSSWHLSFFNFLAIGQIYCILRYYGASVKIKGIGNKAGNGNKIMIDGRENIKKKIQKKGKKIFA